MGILRGSGHGRLQLSLRAFHALLGGGLLAFEWGGGGLNTLLDSRKCTFNLGAGGGPFSFALKRWGPPRR